MFFCSSYRIYGGEFAGANHTDANFGAQQVIAEHAGDKNIDAKHVGTENVGKQQLDAEPAGLDGVSIATEQNCTKRSAADHNGVEHVCAECERVSAE